MPKQGTRVELIHTTDRFTKLEPGATGTVQRVDDVGTVHIHWDDGTSLGLIPGEDQWRELS